MDMILLTKVRIELTKAAEARLEEFEKTLDEEGKIANVHRDIYGRTKEWYEENNMQAPDEFFEKENIKNSYIDFEDDDYEDNYSKLYIIAKDIVTIEEDIDHTIIHMADKNIWVVSEKSEVIFAKREEVLNNVKV